jgi:hypothetical protein
MMGSFQLAADFIALSMTPAKQSSQYVLSPNTEQGGGR